MGGCKPQKGYKMRGLYNKYKKFISATIPFALMISGAAAVAVGAQGLTTLLALIVSLGSLVYAVIVTSLLIFIAQLDAQLSAEREARVQAERARIQAEREKQKIEFMYDYVK